MKKLAAASLIPFHEKWLNLYRHLHANPELSGAESNTSALLASELTALQFKVLSGIGGHGIAAILENGPGPVVLIRADMDALPIEENTGLPYASKLHAPLPDGQSSPVMHACGHDIHMTILIGVAQVMHTLRSQWTGTLIAIGQPSEEKMNGAKAMLDDGLYSRIPHPDFALALHVMPDLDADKVGICPGYVWACADMLTLTVKGVSGHGAAPQTTRDPIVLAAKLILALQTIISREIDPVEPAVISIGAIHGGSTFNVIPEQVSMMLTLRSYKPEVREQLLASIQRHCTGLALAAGLPEELHPVLQQSSIFTPPVYNDPDLTNRMANVFREALGPDKVQTVNPEMVGEDFALFGLVEPPVPLTIFRQGTRTPGTATKAALHSCKYAPDAAIAIPTGVLALSSALLDFLKK